MNRKYYAAVYARVSVSESNSSEFSTSIVNQKAIIEEYLKKNSIELYDYYVDDGYSGGNFDRPSFKRMLCDIDKGIINCVITKDISRLGRDFIGTGNYIYKYFPDKNVRYIAILDNFDSEHPTINDDIIPFKTVINDMYLKDTSKKIKTSRHELMRKGYYMGSTIPYGYKRSSEDSRLLEIDSYSANIVRRIFSMKESGDTSVIIARRLTNEGIDTPQVYNNRNIKDSIVSNVWKPSTIDYILRNEVYIGNLIQRKYERVSLKSKRKRLLPKDEWIVIDHNHPPIIEEYLFDKVNNCRTKNVIRFKKYNYLFKGLVKCAECSSSMLVRRIKRGKSVTPIYCCRTYAKYRNNICSMHYFREEVLNELIIRSVEKVFNSLSQDTLINIGSNVIKKYSVLNSFDKEYSRVLKDISLNENVLSELYKDICSGVISNQDYLIIKKSVDEELSSLYIKRDKLLRNKDKFNIKLNELIASVLNIRDYDKYLFTKLVSKVTIDENKVVRIYFKFKGDFT